MTPKQFAISLLVRTKTGRRAVSSRRFRTILSAAVRAVRQRRDPSLLLKTIRSIGYAEAAASVLTLQRSMLVSFGSMDVGTAHLMNSATGAAVCLFVLALGISMILRSGGSRSARDRKK